MNKWFYYILAGIMSSMSIYIFLFVTQTGLIRENMFMLSSFFIVLLLTLYGMFILETKAVSINKMVMVFFMIFFVYAPVIQINQNIAFNGLPFYTNHEILLLNFMTIIFLALYMVFYKVLWHQNITPKHKKYLNPWVIRLLLMMSYGIFMYFLGEIGFNNMLSRQTSYFPNNIQYQQLILDYSIRLMPVVIAYFALHHLKHKFWILKILTLIPVLFLFFPLGGMSRFIIGVVYLMLLMPFFSKKEYRHGLIPILLIGLLFVFPSIDFFRNNAIENIANFELSFASFTSMDFDSYFMTVQTYRYVMDEGLTYGNQLIGALFTFIPRTLWEAKPVITGMLVTNTLGGEFWNVSSSIIAESVIDFGIFGLIVMPFGMAILIKGMDKLILKSNMLFIQPSFYILLGYTFFHMRGSLLTTFGFMYGGLFAVLLVSISVSLLNLIFKYHEDPL
jgi:oligosaccharide repeat unit polymerase